MSSEIELKLEVTAAAVKHLARSPWLKSLRTAPAKTKKLISVYYDTNDFALRERHAALRVRRIGKKNIQTIKLDKATAGTPLGRIECEREVSGSRPDLSDVRKKDVGGLKLKKFNSALKPIFETSVSRTSIPVHYQGSDLEIAVDVGQVRTGRRRLAIHEIEIELKDGTPSAVTGLGEKIAEQVRTIYGVTSKAARGYALHEGTLKDAVPASNIVLDAGMAVADAFAPVGLSCLHHFAGNRSAVLAGDAEGVHQMRIGLRRLRAAISVFKEMLRDPQTEAIKEELKWLTVELGHTRDMDVLIDSMLPPLEGEATESDAVKSLKSELGDRRTLALDRARAAVKSDRYRRLVLNTAVWLAAGKWCTNGDALIEARRREPLTSFAARELDQRRRKILKKLAEIEALDAHRQHKLRIAIKKLRYATEFFESLFGRSKRNALAKVLKALQSSLGQLNDMRVHAELAHRFANPESTVPGKAPKAFVMGLVAGEERANSGKLLSDAAKTGKRMKAIKPFWKRQA